MIQEQIDAITELFTKISEDADFQEFSLKIMKDIIWSGSVRYTKEETDELVEKLTKKYLKNYDRRRI